MNNFYNVLAGSERGVLHFGVIFGTGLNKSCGAKVTGTFFVIHLTVAETSTVEIAEITNSYTEIMLLVIFEHFCCCFTLDMDPKFMVFFVFAKWVLEPKTDKSRKLIKFKQSRK